MEERSFWSRLVAADGDDGIGAHLDSDDETRMPGAFYTVDGKRPERDRTLGVSTTNASAAHPVAFTADRRSGPTAEQTTTSAASASTLPFDGLKVADFSWIGVGPITAKCLADHGATVIRVESANRIDGLRMQPPFTDGEAGHDRSQFFGTFNSSKQSLSIDLKNEGGLAVAKRLVAWADVVIDSWTPGAMERLGLGPEAIREVNPDAVTVTTSLLGGGGNVLGDGWLRLSRGSDRRLL